MSNRMWEWNECTRLTGYVWLRPDKCRTTMIYRSWSFVGGLRTYSHNWSEVLFGFIWTFVAGGAVRREKGSNYYRLINKLNEFNPQLLIGVPWTLKRHSCKQSIDLKHFSRIYAQAAPVRQFCFDSSQKFHIKVWFMSSYSARYALLSDACINM